MPTKKRKKQEFYDEIDDDFYSELAAPAEEIDREQVLWIEKHKPKAFSELVVHKKKLQELKLKISDLASKTDAKSNILLVTGPSGCGKYSAVMLCCKELGYDFMNIENPLVQFQTRNFHNYNAETFNYDESFIGLLEEFFRQTARYNSTLKIRQNATKSNSKVILLRDFPTEGFNYLKRFHDIIRNFQTSSKGHLLIVLVTTGSSISIDSISDDLTYFPDNSRRPGQFHVIKFNSVAKTFAKTVLKNIADVDGSRRKRKINDALNVRFSNAIEMGGGDLRQTINCFQFFDLLAGCSTTKDEEKSMFELLGKVLYYKEREQFNLSNNESQTAMSAWSVDKIDSLSPNTLMTFLSSEIPQLWLCFERICNGLEILSCLDSIYSRQLFRSNFYLENMFLGLLIGQVSYAHEIQNVSIEIAIQSNRGFNAIRKPQYSYVTAIQKSNSISIESPFDYMRNFLARSNSLPCYNKKEWIRETLPYVRSFIKNPAPHLLKRSLSWDAVELIYNIKEYSDIGRYEAFSATEIEHKKKVIESMDIHTSDFDMDDDDDLIMLENCNINQENQNWWELEDDIDE